MSGQHALTDNGKVERGDQVERAWVAYEQDGSSWARDILIEEYSPLVKYVAGRVAISLPPHIDLDDLYSYGIFGLLDALEKFDRSRQVKFETYAIARVKGAILDGLRASDWVPRSVRQKARAVERAISGLEGRLGRSATVVEVAEEMEMDVEEYLQVLQDVQSASLNSLDELWTADGDPDGSAGGQSLLSVLSDTQSEDPAGAVESQELRHLLAEAIDALPERERLIISLYYYEGLTLKEIGHVLGVSESRISQLHTQSVMRMRGRIFAEVGVHRG